ncbi:lysophospholipid acyltransferase family protein [Salicola sp. Rm-C-2C1-2]|uniref:lysophospholipid acyltransferase family protein n=1 Tax=Salicola sp. Rm-C-2C1-2 TaxID=3141321 RepID=UPI0032E4A10C
MTSLRIRSLRVLLWLIGHLPLALAQRLGCIIGFCLWAARDRTRKVTERSLALAYPQMSHADRRTLVRDSLRETGKLIAEIPIMWESPVPRCLDLIREFQGQHLLNEARTEGRGVVLIVPHLGNWELLGLYYSTQFSMAALYSPPKLAEMESYMSQVRGRGGSELVRADRKGVLRLVSILREGGVVGILPDQVPDASGGTYAPFFGIDVLSMKLVSRLVHKTGARAVVTYCERLPDARGFRLVADQVDQALYEPDTDTSVAALNATVESVVRRVPAQYQWEYKRFRKRPPGEPNPYRDL